MDWQTSEDTVAARPVTDADARALVGKPPASGAWREGDPVADRSFVTGGTLTTEAGARIPGVRVAYESWGELDAGRSNAVLVLHALTGDPHLVGSAGPGQPTDGWWEGVVGPGLALDTDRWFVVAPNVLGGCAGTTGPASLGPDQSEWGGRFPYLTIRDQVAAQLAFADALGIDRFAAVVGGSMGGMHALEWAVTAPDRVGALAVLAAPAASSADQIALNSVQTEAVRADPRFRGGDYYGAVDGDGPHRGLALARRMALLNYRSGSELNDRFGRSWQSGVSPLGHHGRFAVESYLDFHGNRFTRRFDANSYIRLVDAMSSHDVGRDRGGVEAALATYAGPALVLGIDSDRLYPVADQRRVARGLRGALDGPEPTLLESPFGHDGFLIEREAVGAALRRLLAT
ncbi:homoserine O-acetyltransferase MetX [Amnibacterium kyonggiense]|uniref:Homoserine O-acetyltransferase n=1 Tax=Amnibacterium kyonggiense TaxID=595671 RepID=A0A4R7FER8_9MICO|nr:homoserine O-acetyltransferase [Amnibacterium kyonggiense]TDS75863.1 homoserine O-acetyltransferase [Amnibacterium kyonggiense]